MSRGPDGEYRGPASSGGITQLHRVIDLVNSGHDGESIKAWCEKEIRRLSVFARTGVSVGWGADK